MAGGANILCITQWRCDWHTFNRPRLAVFLFRVLLQNGRFCYCNIGTKFSQDEVKLEKPAWP